MCGILAIARARPADGPVLPERSLTRAMERLARRGPDGRGTYTSPDRRVLLAHARLAIQDLTPSGRQPMADDPDRPRVVVTYNGEVYNAPALRRELERGGADFRSTSDCEVLVHGYGRWGFRGLLERVQGMYAVVLLDQRELTAPTLYAAVDHAGMKPLVYWFDAGGRAAGARLAIASDCDALLGALAEEPGFDRRVDGQALAHVLSVGYIPAPWTAWRGVRKLGPGEMLTWRPGGMAAPMPERHWLPPESIEPEPAPDAQERFESLLRTVADEHMLSDVPVGLFLSAGLDSSALALALAQGGHADDLAACTLACEGVDPSIDESTGAADLCRLMMMRHRTVRFGPEDLNATLDHAGEAFDEPQGFTALLTAVRIARAVRIGTDRSPAGPAVVIAGDGGDEALAGYPWHTTAPNNPHAMTELKRAVPLRTEPAEGLDTPACDPAVRAAAARALAARSFAHRYLCRVFPGFHPVESRSLLGALEPEYDEGVFVDWLARHDAPHLPHPRRLQRLDVLGFCAGSILPKTDRAAMSVALELRAPFLDRRVLDHALSRPVDPRETAPGSSKPALRDMLSRAAAAGLVPPGVLLRPKQGFSVKTGAPTAFGSLAEARLPESRLVRDGVLRRDWRAFLPQNADAREVRTFTLAMLAAWYERRAG